MKAENGFALAALMIVVMATSIVLSAALPYYLTQAQREMEEELIFRGEEYVRAIQKYKRLFGIYPPNIEALSDTNGLPFLRREYRDPTSGTSFRLLTLNQDGTINGSAVYSRSSVNAELAAESNPETKTQPNASQLSTPREGIERKKDAVESHQGNLNAQGLQSSFAGQFQGIAGGGIIGVAPESDQRTLKVYNQRNQYNEWEFIAISNVDIIEEERQRPRSLPLELNQENQFSPLPRN